MENLFLYVTHLSLKACVVILLIVAVRFLIRKQPKSYSYALWAVVFFSLVVNFQLPPLKNSSINTPVNRLQNQLLTRYDNVLNTYTEDVTVHFTDSVEYYEAIEKGITPIYNEQTDTQYVVTGVETRQSPATVSDHLPKAYFLWFAGILAAAFMVIKNSLDISSRLKYSTKYQDNIYIAENLPSPFVFGIVKPKIYIPESLRLKDLSYIITHEQTHIKRKDHIIKPVCLFITIIHWFNPLVWLAFRMMCRDMEMSCDEKVILQLGNDNKKAYSMLLLDFATDKSLATAVLFGESHAENRIKNVLKYKKPAKIAALVLTAIVALCLTFPLLSDEFNSTPPAAAPVTFYEVLDSRNDIADDQYRYRITSGSGFVWLDGYSLWVDGQPLYPYMTEEKTHEALLKGVRDHGLNLGNSLMYSSPTGVRIDDNPEDISISLAYVPYNTTGQDIIIDYSNNTETVTTPLYLPEGFDALRTYGHDRVSDTITYTAVSGKYEDTEKPVDLLIKTENGIGKVVYEGPINVATNGVRFLNENVGFMSHSTYLEIPVALITIDGGENWQYLDFTQLRYDDFTRYASCYMFIYDQTVEIRFHGRSNESNIAYPEDNYAIISFDGGLTWAGYTRSRRENYRGFQYIKVTEDIPVSLLLGTEPLIYSEINSVLGVDYTPWVERLDNESELRYAAYIGRNGGGISSSESEARKEILNVFRFVRTGEKLDDESRELKTVKQSHICYYISLIDKSEAKNYLNLTFSEDFKYVSLCTEENHIQGCKSHDFYKVENTQTIKGLFLLNDNLHRFIQSNPDTYGNASILPAAE